MKTKDLMIPFQERLKTDTTLREAASILRSGVKGGVKP